METYLSVDSFELKNVTDLSLNPLSDMPVLGALNSAANKDMSKIWTNWDTII